MARHLVLTVHGVGEQRPGETVDQVVGAATTWMDKNPRPPVEVKRNMIELAEGHFDGSTRNAKLFPVHMCKVTEVGNTEDEALFAEVFWADRSPAPKGLINTVLDLIWVVLALGYLAMDNVEQTHRRSDMTLEDAGARATFAAKVVHLFTWVFFGIVATMNLYLLLGAVPMLMDLVFDAETQAKPIDRAHLGLLVLLYAGGAATGYFREKQARTYLRRVFWRGMGFVSAGLLLAMVLGPQGLAWWTYVPQSGPALEPVAQFVSVQIFALGAFWAFQSVLVVVMILTALLPIQIADGIAGHRRLYPSICAGMLVLWMFFISGLWLSLQKVVQSTPKVKDGVLAVLFEGHLQEALDSISIVFVAMVALVVIGGTVFALRKILKKALHSRSEIVSRAILNRMAQMVFLGAGVVMAVIAVRSGLAMMDETLLCNPTDKTQSCGPVSNALHALAQHKGQVGLLVVAATAAIYRFTDVVAAALGVGRDIVTYAKRDACALWEDGAKRRANYPDRKAIEERFYRTLYYALQVFEADHITVISHSQGTIVATRMLADPRVKRRIGDRTCSLITMGAPVTHIYQKYFPEMFTVDVAALPDRWFNIFREDDFVGTKIDGGHIPNTRNLPVPPGGHTGYFTDHDVWQHLCGAEIGFHLFNPKTV